MPPKLTLSSEEWITQKETTTKDGKNFDKTVVLEIAPNTTGKMRYAIATIIAKTPGKEIIEKNVKISQASASASLVITPVVKTIVNAASNINVSLISERKWKAYTDSEWLTIDKESGTGDKQIVVSGYENLAGE